MAEQTVIDRLRDEAVAIVSALQGISEPSLQSAAADHFRKALLLSAASYFEYRVCECVLNHVRSRTSGSALVENFVRNQAVARRYHGWFEWKDNNANSFFGAFGPDFKALMTKRVRESDQLKESIRAFMEIGRQRNLMVHQDYATFPLEKTLEEIYASYRQALDFVDQLPVFLDELDVAKPAEAPAALAADSASGNVDVRSRTG